MALRRRKTRNLGNLTRGRFGSAPRQRARSAADEAADCRENERGAPFGRRRRGKTKGRESDSEIYTSCHNVAKSGGNHRKVGKIVKKVGIKQLTNAFFHGKINSAGMRKGCISPFLHLFCGLKSRGTSVRGGRARRLGFKERRKRPPKHRFL